VILFVPGANLPPVLGRLRQGGAAARDAIPSSVRRRSSRARRTPRAPRAPRVAASAGEAGVIRAGRVPARAGPACAVARRRSAAGSARARTRGTRVAAPKPDGEGEAQAERREPSRCCGCLPAESGGLLAHGVTVDRFVIPGLVGRVWVNPVRAKGALPRKLDDQNAKSRTAGASAAATDGPRRGQGRNVGARRRAPRPRESCSPCSTAPPRLAEGELRRLPRALRDS